MADVSSFTLLDIRTDTGDDVVTVTVTGEVDLANVGELRRTLAAVAPDPAVRRLVCDLTQVTFLACSGLTALLEAQDTLTARGARLEVLAASPAVLRPIEMTGLAKQLPVRHPH